LGVVESENVEIAQNHSVAVQKLYWGIRRYPFAVYESAGIREGFDSDLALGVGEDTMGVEDVGAGELHVGCFAAQSPCYGGTGLELINQALLC
jgi:hypothetical protein